MQQGWKQILHFVILDFEQFCHTISDLNQRHSAVKSINRQKFLTMGSFQMKHNTCIAMSNMQLVTPQVVTTSNNSHNSMGSPWRSLSKLRSNAHTEHRVTAPLSSCSMLRDHVAGFRGVVLGFWPHSSVLTAADLSGPNCKNLPKIRFRKLVKSTAHPYMPATIWQIFIWRYNHRKRKRCQICWNFFGNGREIITCESFFGAF